MDKAAAARLLAVYLPVTAAALALFIRKPQPRLFPAALVGFSWNLALLPALQLVNESAGWWTFHAEGGLLRGMPVDLILGWAVLWGVLPILAFRETHLAWVGVLFAATDLVVMPLTSPIIVLSDRWLVGEACALALGLLPGLLFARWTLDDTHLAPRAALHVLTAGGVFVFLIPEVAFALSSGAKGWAALLEEPRWLSSLEVQAVAALAVFGVSAVQEFAERGGGTPIPFDPPKRLVESGLYRYIANPMQVSCTLVMTAWGAVLRSPWLAVGGVMSLVYSLGLAAWDEDQDMAQRFGARWEIYKGNVKSWRPRLTPFHPADRPVPRLYIASSCGPCSEVRRWFASRRPTALEIIPAERHPSGSLTRIAYDPMDGTPSNEGVKAFARGLEHLGFAWACAGSLLRLPGISHLVQLLLDASGLGPRAIPRLAGEPSTLSVKDDPGAARQVVVSGRS